LIRLIEEVDVKRNVQLLKIPKSLANLGEEKIEIPATAGKSDARGRRGLYRPDMGDAN